MIQLNTTSQSLQVLLAAAGAIPWHAAWHEKTASTHTPGSANGVTNGTTPVDLVTVPSSSSAWREAHFVWIRNNSGAPATVTIRYKDGANNRDLLAIAMDDGDMLEYTAALGWRVLNSVGRLRVEVGAVGGGSVPTGTGFYHVTGGVMDAAAKLVDTADINNDQVTDTKLRNSGAVSVIGRSVNSAGDPADIAASADLQYLRRAAAVVGFGFDPILSPAQIVANQNDYNPGSGLIWRINSDAARDITGILAGADGQRLEIVNVGAFTIRLMHQNVGSAAANRILASGAANISLPANGRAEGWYDATTLRWRLDLV